MLELLDAQKEELRVAELEDLIIRVAMSFEDQDLSDPRILNGLLTSYMGLVEEVEDEDDYPEWPDPGKGEKLFRKTWIKYVTTRMKVSREVAEENYCGFFMDGINFDWFSKKMLVRFARAVGAKDCARWRAMKALDEHARTGKLEKVFS